MRKAAIIASLMAAMTGIQNANYSLFNNYHGIRDRKRRKSVANGSTPNRYAKPHQGKQECSRRQKQNPGGLIYDCSIMANRRLQNGH